ncbi:hypothetical protein [Mucisphaera sp.]|uniref:hypothetical protein n=1 Tax=Mucisphaera sp. TaxID=2913024 RepID=UPI003D101F25
MSPDNPQWILLAVLPQAILTGLIALVSARYLCRLAPRPTSAAVTLIITAAFTTSFLILFGLPNLPPKVERDHLLITILPAATAIALLGTFFKLPLLLWPARLALAIAVPLLAVWGSPFLNPESSRAWDTAGQLLYLALPAALIFIPRILTAFRTQTDTPRHRAAVLATTALATGLLGLFSEAAGVGQLAIALTGILTAVAVASLLIRSTKRQLQLEDLTLPLLALLTLSALHFAGLQPRHALTLALAYTAWTAIPLIPVLNNHPLTTLLTRWTALLALLAWPVTEAAITFITEYDDTYTN